MNMKSYSSIGKICELSKLVLVDLSEAALISEESAECTRIVSDLQGSILLEIFSGQY